MIIRIVGSMRFLPEFEEAKKDLEEKGHSVILPEPDPEDLTAAKKRALMQKFNDDLGSSDALLVMNYTKDGKENHIGVNTLMEIGMAFNRGKKIFVLNPFPEHCKDELEAIGCEVLRGDVTAL